MERIVALFDIGNTETKQPTRIVKLWNTDEEAISYVDNYTSSVRKGFTWTYCANETLQATAPGAVIELYGYSDKAKTDIRDIITVYHVGAEDPDNDPMKRLLRALVRDFTECFENGDAADEELEHMPYTIAVLERILKNVDEIEAKYKTELTINKEENDNV